MAHDVEPRVVVNPNVMFGKPVIAGTRITVETSLDHLAAGETIDQVLVAYPRLSREAVLAALRYAANMVRNATAPADALASAPEAGVRANPLVVNRSCLSRTRVSVAR